MQKEDKRHRTREYKIVQDYNGSWVPLWSMGFRVGCHPPCTDEPRIPLSRGDHVRVTRWKKYWLYGDKVIAGGDASSTNSNGSAPAVNTGPDRVRGWFPRRCAVDFVDNSRSSAAVDGGSAARRRQQVRHDESGEPPAIAGDSRRSSKDNKENKKRK